MNSNTNFLNTTIEVLSTKGLVTRKLHEIHAGMKKIYVTRVFRFGVKLMPA